MTAPVPAQLTAHPSIIAIGSVIQSGHGFAGPGLDQLSHRQPHLLRLAIRGSGSAQAMPAARLL